MMRHIHRIYVYTELRIEEKKKLVIGQVQKGGQTGMLNPALRVDGSGIGSQDACMMLLTRAQPWPH